MFVSALVLLDECWLPKRSRFSKYFFIKCVRFNLGSQRFILENDIGIPRGGRGEDSQVLDLDTQFADVTYKFKSQHVHCFPGRANARG